MKAVSIAVMALLGQVSAISLKNSALQQSESLVEVEENRPDDTILLQTGADIQIDRSQERVNLSQHHAAKRLRQNLGIRRENLYPPAASGADWFELDNPDERIHGSNRFEEADDQSPHDPEVVDAPEDMKRVGNDHEELHNAKLGPDGYFTGFFHKDHQGNYAQRKRRHHFNDNAMVQVSDHDNDSEDIPYSYEADGARAAPTDGQSDYDLVQLKQNVKTGEDRQAWGAYLQHQANVVIEDQKKKNDEMERVYAQEEDESSFEFLQLKSRFNHDDDTQDIDEGQDPIQLHQKGVRNTGENIIDMHQIKAERIEEKKENDETEVQQYMQEQKEEDKKELAAATERDQTKQKQEIEANKSQKEREESKDVNEQIDNYVKH